MNATVDIARVNRRAVSFGVSTMLLGLAFVAACAATFVLNGYGLYILTLTGIFALVALGLNLLTGYAGQISLCHAAFFGVGAYTTAILTQKAGFPYLLSMLKDSFMTRPNTIVCPGDKMALAMQLIFTPMIWQLADRKKKAF